MQLNLLKAGGKAVRSMRAMHGHGADNEGLAEQLERMRREVSCLKIHWIICFQVGQQRQEINRLEQTALASPSRGTRLQNVMGGAKPAPVTWSKSSVISSHGTTSKLHPVNHDSAELRENQRVASSWPHAPFVSSHATTPPPLIPSESQQLSMGSDGGQSQPEHHPNQQTWVQQVEQLQLRVHHLEDLSRRLKQE